MIKSIALMFVVFVAGCTGGCASAPKPVPRESEGAFQYAVTLRISVFCPSPEGYRLTSGGSAVAVAPGKAITAYHVVEDNCAGAVYLALAFDGSEHTVVPTRTAPEADAALLEILDGTSFKRWTAPAPIVPDLDDVVCSIGGDFHVSFMKKCGRVNANEPGWIYTSLWTKRGNSGGPVFRGRELIGIVVASFMDPLSEWQSKTSAATAWVHLIGGV